METRNRAFLPLRNVFQTWGSWENLKLVFQGFFFPSDDWCPLEGKNKLSLLCDLSILKISWEDDYICPHESSGESVTSGRVFHGESGMGTAQRPQAFPGLHALGDTQSPGYSRKITHLTKKLMDWCWSWSSDTLTTWCKELTHWKRPWCWERLKAGGEGVTEDEMVGWHHRLNGHEFEQAPGDGDREGQGSLVSCSPWGHRESDKTERQNNHQERGKSPVERKKIDSCQHQEDTDKGMISGQGQWVTSSPTAQRSLQCITTMRDQWPGSLVGDGHLAEGGQLEMRRSQPTLGRRSTDVEQRRSFDSQVCWEVSYELEYKNLGVCVCVWSHFIVCVSDASSAKNSLTYLTELLRFIYPHM